MLSIAATLLERRKRLSCNGCSRDEPVSCRELFVVDNDMEKGGAGNDDDANQGT